MKYSKLGTTDVKVSRICLGSMNWGEQNTEKDAHEQLDYAISRGINFIDTAEMYPIPPHKESQGKTETYIGTWLQKRKNRKDLVIASKVAGPTDLTYLRNGETPRLNKKNIKIAIEGSLKRLQTDYIDFYQLHWPDRKTNFFGKRGFEYDSSEESIPMEETLEVLQELIKEGKIRYASVSNETAWGVMNYLRLHEQKNLPRIQTIQNPYSLIMRGFEIGLAEVCIREQVSLLVYSPLAQGVLSGKYLGGILPPESRFAYSQRNHPRYNPPHAQPVVHEYIELAKKYNLDPSQMALSFVNSRPFVTSTIIGATTMEQLRMDIDSIDVELSSDVLTGISEIYTRSPDPIA